MWFSLIDRTANKSAACVTVQPYIINIGAIFFLFSRFYNFFTIFFEKIDLNLRVLSLQY